MTNVNITYSELTDAATFMDTQRGVITDALTLLQNRVTLLTSEGFRTDQASGQYEDSYNQLNTGISQAVGGLEGMAGFLRSVAQTYSTVDSQLAAGLQS